ncbi:MAG: TetR/AcrR family transcriptional regulator [Actinomyces bowdenii]|nr:TetR/AcrR family transcriptional regulator [Actinomyces bowdenii]
MDSPEIPSAVRAPASVARQRMPAADRRRQLLDAALRTVRQDGVGELSLAGVARACGVTKPVAYSHFGTLVGLLQAVLEEVEAHYEAQVLGAVAEARAKGLSRVGLLEVLCRTYVETSIAHGAVHWEVTSALISQGRTPRLELRIRRRLVLVVQESFGLGQEAAELAVLSFLGAADSLCEEIRHAGLDRERAVRHLVALFGPMAGADGLAGRRAETTSLRGTDVAWRNGRTP